MSKNGMKRRRGELASEFAERQAIRGKWFYLTLDLIPQAKARARWSSKTKRFYTPEETRRFENQVIAHAKMLWTHRELEGPLRVNVDFYLGSEKENHNGLHMQRPDIDNLIKSTFDALNGICWHDDAVIAEVTARKFWSDKGRIALEIYTL